MKKLLKKSLVIMGLAAPMMLSGCGGTQEQHSHNYNYDAPEWTWSEDFSSASVKFPCVDGDGWTEAYSAEIDVDDQNPTCTEGSKDTYTATVVVEGRTFTDTKEVTEDALGHRYTELEVVGNKTNFESGETFSLDGVTVYKVCKADDHKEEVTSGITVEYQNGVSFKAGDTKVIIKAAGLSKEVTVTVEKATNYISMEASYSTTCHVAPTVEATSDHGEPVVKLYNGSDVEVAAEDLVAGGTYYVKAVVAEGAEYKGAEAIAPLTVSHNFNQSVVSGEHQKDEATCEGDAVYYKSCVCGANGEETFVDEESALGHQYTSLEVSGEFKKSYYAFETFDPTGLVVKKVCARDSNHKEVVASGDISFEYENGSEFHYGDDKVTVKAGELEVEITDISVAKVVTTISGLPESLETKCHVMPSFSGVSSNAGTPTIKVYSDQTYSNEVGEDGLEEGTYYVKAEIAESDDRTGATATATLSVSHDYKTVVDDKVIGTKQDVCACEDSKTAVPVTADDIDFTVNKYGASIWDISGDTPSDQSWMISTTSTPYAITKVNMPYKNYGGKTWRNDLPKINFNVFECVSFDLAITNWANGVKLGFDSSVASTGTEIAKETKEGGKVTLIKTAEDTVTVRFLFKDWYNLDISKEFKGAGYVNGTEAISFFSTASDGDYFFRLNNFKFFEDHEMGTSFLADKIAIGNKACIHCGLESTEKVMPSIDFTSNKYGATYLKGDNDDQSWKIGISENAIEYKLYGDPMTEFTLVLPKINFNDFSDVEIKLYSANWYENNGIGFTMDDAIGCVNHTTYGGSKTGTLKFGWSGDKLVATLNFEYVSISTVVTDADVIAGTKGFRFYVTDLYDRSLVASDFNFFTTHAYGGTSTESGKISALKRTCNLGGETEVLGHSSIDFTTELYGASEYNYTDSSDISWIMQKTSTSLSFKSYDLDKVFGMFMPKINFNDFGKVSIDVSSTDKMTSRMGWGFSKETADTGTYKLSGEETTSGSLVFEWVNGKLMATFTLNNIEFTEEVTDSSIISGDASFGVYMTTHYDRFITFSNFAFTLK